MREIPDRVAVPVILNAFFLKSLAANNFFNRYAIFAPSVCQLGRMFPRVDPKVRKSSIDFAAYEDDKNLKKIAPEECES